MRGCASVARCGLPIKGKVGFMLEKMAVLASTNESTNANAIAGFVNFVKVVKSVKVVKA